MLTLYYRHNKDMPSVKSEQVYSTSLHNCTYSAGQPVIFSRDSIIGGRKIGDGARGLEICKVNKRNQYFGEKEYISKWGNICNKETKWNKDH